MKTGRSWALAFATSVAVACSSPATPANQSPTPRMSDSSSQTSVGAAPATTTASASQASAPPTPADTADVASGCQAPLATLPAGTVVSAAFVTTEDRLQAWRIKLGQVIGMFPDATIYASPLPDSTDNADVVQTPTGPEAGAPSNSSVALCYFDGDFGRPRGDPPSSVPDASRLVVIVRDRSWDIAAMGFADQLAIVDPNR